MNHRAGILLQYLVLVRQDEIFEENRGHHGSRVVLIQHTRARRPTAPASGALPAVEVAECLRQGLAHSLPDLGAAAKQLPQLPGMIIELEDKTLRAKQSRGDNPTARALRLDYYSLKKRVETDGLRDGSGRRKVGHVHKFPRSRARRFRVSSGFWFGMREGTEGVLGYSARRVLSLISFPSFLKQTDSGTRSVATLLVGDLAEKRMKEPLPGVSYAPRFFGRRARRPRCGHQASARLRQGDAVHAGACLVNVIGLDSGVQQHNGGKNNNGNNGRRLEFEMQIVRKASSIRADEGHDNRRGSMGMRGVQRGLV